MKCPHCQIDLKISDRAEVEIDFCPQCRGVWLDKGELDKILERSKSNDQDYEDDDWQNKDPQSSQPRKKKKESWFEEIFDIFGG